MSAFCGGSATQPSGGVNVTPSAEIGPLTAAAAGAWGVPLRTLFAVQALTTGAAFLLLAGLAVHRLQHVTASPKDWDAFFAAAHDGDLERLISVLDPDVVLRSDVGAGVTHYRGAEKVAGNAVLYAHPDRIVHPAVVNGAAGVVVTRDGALFSVMAFTVAAGRIVEIEAYAAPDLTTRLGAELGLALSTQESGRGSWTVSTMVPSGSLR